MRLLNEVRTERSPNMAIIYKWSWASPGLICAQQAVTYRARRPFYEYKKTFANSLERGSSVGKSLKFKNAVTEHARAKNKSILTHACSGVFDAGMVPWRRVMCFPMVLFQHKRNHSVMKITTTARTRARVCDVVQLTKERKIINLATKITWHNASMWTAHDLHQTQSTAQHNIQNGKDHSSVRMRR